MRRAISVRLDEAAMKALSRLEAAGMSPSQAIRRALIEAAERLQKREALVAEVAALAADDADRAEMLVVAEMMAKVRAQG
jgi:predicted type IV restriction endonuclease